MANNEAIKINIVEDSNETIAEAPRETLQERGKKVYEVVASELSLEELLSIDIKAKENETAEEKAQRIATLREIKARLEEEYKKETGEEYGKQAVEETEKLAVAEKEKLAAAEAEALGEETLTEAEPDQKVEVEEEITNEKIEEFIKNPETIPPETKEIIEEAKKKPGLKDRFKQVVLAVLASAILIGGVAGVAAKAQQYFDDQNNDKAPIVALHDADDDQSGEGLEPLTLHYDYSDWADFDHKLGPNNYGYDVSDLHGDEAGMKAAFIEAAGENPEVLSSYAYEYLTDHEKADLGISGLTAVEIDNLLSDENNPNSELMRQMIYNKIVDIVNDDGTSFVFKLANGMEYSYYMYGDDSNHDGKYSPSEMHLGYDEVERHNSKQFDIERTIDGEKVKVGSSINEDCGLQPTKGGTPPIGLSLVPTPDLISTPGVTPTTPDKSTPNEPNEPTPTTPDKSTTPDPSPEPSPDPSPEPSPDPTPDPSPEPSPDPTPEPEPEPTPQPKNQAEANENSGADKGIVTPEKQEREITPEPVADETHPYNQETNTYDYTPEEQAAQIGYEVENDIKEVGQESAPITAPEEIAAAEEMVQNQTAPEMVTGTQQGAEGEAGQANNFDAGATVGTGEVTGNTLSADESGNTIQENLENATGNQEANPTGNYSQGF